MTLAPSIIFLPPTLAQAEDVVKVLFVVASIVIWVGAQIFSAAKAKQKRNEAQQRLETAESIRRKTRREIRSAKREGAGMTQRRSEPTRLERQSGPRQERAQRNRQEEELPWARSDSIPEAPAKRPTPPVAPPATRGGPAPKRPRPHVAAEGAGSGRGIGPARLKQTPPITAGGITQHEIGSRADRRQHDGATGGGSGHDPQHATAARIARILRSPNARDALVLSEVLSPPVALRERP